MDQLTIKGICVHHPMPGSAYAGMYSVLDIHSGNLVQAGGVHPRPRLYDTLDVAQRAADDINRRHGPMWKCVPALLVA